MPVNYMIFVKNGMGYELSFSSPTVIMSSTKLGMMDSVIEGEDDTEGIKAIQEIISNNNNTNKGQRCLNNLQSKNDESNIKKEYNPNRKF